MEWKAAANVGIELSVKEHYYAYYGKYTYKHCTSWSQTENKTKHCAIPVRDSLLPFRLKILGAKD